MRVVAVLALLAAPAVAFMGTPISVKVFNYFN